MKNNNTAKAIFFAIPILAFSYLMAGFLVLVLNKIPLGKALKMWHLNYTYEAISQGYPYAWSAFGLAVLISVLVLLALIVFAKQKESLYGEARFANSGEIAKTGLFGDSKNYVKRGIIVGKYGSKFLKFGGQQFVALGAPTRSGKGVGIVIPNLLHWEESAVVQDIKQECFDYTSKYRKEKLGQEVYLFNPFSARTHRYNPFTYIDMLDDEKADSQLMDLANIIYPSDDGKDAFWALQAQNLFIGLCYLYKDLVYTEEGIDFLETHKLQVEFSFFGILQLSKGFDFEVDGEKYSGFESTYEFLKSLEMLDQPTIRRLSSYMNINSENTKSSVMASFNAPISAFEGETLKNATSDSDFDLRDLRKKKMTIYIGITPDQLKNSQFILNIFWSQLILLNTKELPQQNKELKYACLLLMDEFTAPGRIGILQTSVSFIAGYNLRLLTIYQSLSQLETPPPLGYGKEGAKTLLTNHACQIFYAPREIEDAEAISKILGNKTVKQTSKSHNHGGSGGGSRSISETHRALMLPQELREMPFENELITIDSGKPIKCNKAFYYSDPHFMDKFKAVSPSLKGIKGIPKRDELENAILSGECNIEIPIQN